MPNCPECTHREKKKIQEKYESEVPEEERSREDLFKLYDEIDIPMKMDEKNRRNFRYPIQTKSKRKDSRRQT